MLLYPVCTQQHWKLHSLYEKQNKYNYQQINETLNTLKFDTVEVPIIKTKHSCKNESN